MLADIVHLHSCLVEVLVRGDVIDALIDARRAGKIRRAADSGDNDALDRAVASGRFDSLQLSWSLCDQRAAAVIERAHAAGLGVIAKRPLANAPWRFADRPIGHEAELYWERWQVLALEPGALAWDELAARFSAHTPGVSSAIVGTRSVTHLGRNAELVREARCRRPRSPRCAPGGKRSGPTGRRGSEGGGQNAATARPTWTDSVPRGIAARARWLPQRRRDRPDGPAGGEGGRVDVSAELSGGHEPQRDSTAGVQPENI